MASHSPKLISRSFFALTAGLGVLLISGIVIGFQYGSSKVWFLPFVASALAFLSSGIALRKQLPFLLALALIALPGLAPILSSPSVGLYFLMLMLSFWSMVIQRQYLPKLKASYFPTLAIALLSYSLIIRIVFGALQLAVIQVSIFDMLLLAICLKGIMTSESQKKQFVIAALLVLYGIIFQSRILLIAPAVFWLAMILSSRFPALFKAVVGALIALMAALPILLLFGIDQETVAATVEISSLNVLQERGIEEYKRVFLIMQGLDAIRKAGFFPTGYGYDAYFAIVGDSPFQIVPQLLPLTLGAYGGLHMPFVFFFCFFAMLRRQGFREPESVACLVLLLFLLGHEYIFNPFFAVSVCIIRCRVTETSLSRSW